MKSRATETVTSNEEFVRLRIFDGDLQVDEASTELIRLARCQARSAEDREMEWRRRAFTAEKRLAELERSN